mmetsp:Transcript_689/g.965  ORF Transcript_689/g.965 Transcript_689/m.965 type:complete len:180 (+) Transcript_689:29-568(+)|eukprot:CAMPEP_0170075302 /NCGR_PEP_ID=MMETSP0019_2-20121128/12459_1 /TAXON_ID=98059 /ORGANISM="Dinobryon sp., Strain UTEXLB2267" /LENGTH=179 /DNA_ID=CAMNT_0010286175 /DNA_START=22 /DNA_END=561 /DNA_ORIENTATION=-
MSTFEGIRKITGHVRPTGTKSNESKIVEVIPGLYTARFEDIKEPDSFKANGLDADLGVVINAAIANNQCPTRTGFYGPDIDVVPLNILDDLSSDATSAILESNAAIKKAAASGKSAIVHCNGSVSRATVLLIAYIMEAKKISAEAATAIVKAKWDTTWPNDTFVHNLIDFEATLGLNKK